MKKIVLPFILFFLAGAAIVNAQSSLRFGPTVGLNFANIGGKDATGNLSTKTGLFIGGFMTYQFSDMFALEPQVVYSMKGATSAQGGVNSTISLNYIDIPVFLKLYIPLAGNSNIKPEIYVGPSFGFNVAASIEQTANGQTNTADVSSQVKGFDMGLGFGGGVAFGVGSGLLDFSVRYSLGLTSWDNSGNNLTLTNNVFSIVAGYAFSTN